MSAAPLTEAKREYGVETDVLTLQRYVLKTQRKHPDAQGDLTLLMTSLITAFKAIASATQRAGLANLYAFIKILSAIHCIHTFFKNDYKLAC